MSRKIYIFFIAFVSTYASAAPVEAIKQPDIDFTVSGLALKSQSSAEPKSGSNYQGGWEVNGSYKISPNKDISIDWTHVKSNK